MLSAPVQGPHCSSHHWVPLLWTLPRSLSPSSSQRCHPWPSSPLSVRLLARGDSRAIVTELPCQAACVAAGRGGGGTSCWRGLAAAGFCSTLRSWKSSQAGATAAVTLHRGGRDPPFLLAVSPPAFPVPAVPPSAFVAQPQQTQLLPKPPGRLPTFLSVFLPVSEVPAAFQLLFSSLVFTRACPRAPCCLGHPSAEQPEL